MMSKSYFKSIVRSNYGKKAKEYQKNPTFNNRTWKNLLNVSIKQEFRFHVAIFIDAVFFDNITAYIGLDLSMEMLSQTVRKKNCYFVNGDLEEIPFNDETFSVVISNSVLHWLNIPEYGLTPRLACGEIDNYEAIITKTRDIVKILLENNLINQ
ncbi:class I SAM-dependent methyltransferase [Desulfobacterota bacterium AH_259_B03_O07]|nr:class I SAM-dependent methyltransferase [Desulfobacterota bacterium AH_259_B03_O07]